MNAWGRRSFAIPTSDSQSAAVVDPRYIERAIEIATSAKRSLASLAADSNVL